MCKILIMSGLDPKKKKLNWSFIKAMGAAMSDNNRDGLGYTAIDKDGNMFGERWWFNWQAFNNYNVMSKVRKREHEKYTGIKDMLKGFVDLEDVPDEIPFEKYNTFGNKTEDITAITLHTRYATSGKEFNNTHPFVDIEQDTSLIHNGVINNHCDADKVRSTCDSERILNKYLEHQVNINSADIQNMVDELKGYFACGIFSKDNEGKRILDVFKSRARLAGAFIKELNCVVLSTDLDDIKNVCDELGLTIVSKASKVEDDKLVRFDAITGKVILSRNYKDTANHYNTSSYGTTNQGYKGSHGYYRNGKWYSYSDSNWQSKVDEHEKQVKEVTNNVLPIYQGNAPVKSEAEVQSSQSKAAEEVNENADVIDKIIKKYSQDILNEREAILDGWELVNGYWIEKKNVKH